MIRVPRSEQLGVRSASQALRPVRSRTARKRFHAWAERLEDRTVMASLDLVANQLIYSAGPGIANILTISTQGPAGNYTISDVEPIALSLSALTAGWSYVSPFSVTGPDASVTKMTIGLLDLVNTVNIQSISCDATIQTTSVFDGFNFRGDGIGLGATVTVESSLVTPVNAFGSFDMGFLPGTISLDDTGLITRYQVDGHGAVVDRSGKFSAGDPNLSLVNVPAGGLTLGVNTLGTSVSPLSVTTTVASNLPGQTQVTAVNPNGTFFQRGFTTTDLNKIVVGGTSADDAVVVDYGLGDPLPLHGLTFDGGTGGYNLLTLQGNGVTFASETIHATGPGAGSIDYQYPGPGGGNAIQFSNLTPINDTVPALSLNIITPLAAENVDVGQGPIIGPFTTMAVSGPGNPFEQMRFANKSTLNLTTTGNTGVVRVDTSVPATGLTNVNVTSQSGQGRVDYLASSVAGPYTLNASLAFPTLSDGTVTTELHDVSGLAITAAAPLALWVNGTSGNDDYVVHETAANTGDLAVTLGNLPVVATGFGNYTLLGAGGGIDSVRVVGSHGPETATYDDGLVTLNSFTVLVGSDVDNVFIDLPGNLANHLNFASGTSGKLYRALVGDQQNAAAFQIYSDPTASFLSKTVQVTGVVTTSFPAQENLEVWGTSSANHFYMSDLTGFVRVNSGPYLNFTPFATVGLFGGGFANDRLDYEANLTGPGSYTFTPGYHPTLATPSTTVKIDGIESMGMYGPGAAGALTIAAIPPGGSQGTAVNYAATVTGPGQGDLTAAFNQPTTFSLDAHGFGSYDLSGSTTGVSSLAVNGPSTGGAAIYNGSSLIVNGLTLNIDPNIQAVAVNLQNAPGSSLSIAATGATQVFRFREDGSQYNASLEILAAPLGSVLRTFQLQGVASVGFNAVGVSNALELRGTSSANHFSMSDGYVRTSNGSYLDYTPFSTVRLFGGGFAADRLDYRALLTTAYTLTGGNASTLTVPLPGHTVSVSLAGIQSMGMFGPGAAGILRVLGVPAGGGQGAAINYLVGVTGPGQGSLDAGFNQPSLYTLHAEGFGEYDLSGSGSGVNTLAVRGTSGDDTATYNGSTLVVDGLKLVADPSITQVSLDMLGGFNSIALSGAGATDAFAIAPATGGSVTGPLIASIGALRPIQLVATDSIVVVPTGPGNSLNVTGDANDNAISMSDQTVRFGQGPNISFAGIGVVGLFGAGGFDALNYNGGNVNYTFDPRTFTQGILSTTGLTTTFHNVAAFHFYGSPSAPANFKLLEAPTATVTVQMQYPPATGYLSTVMQAMSIVTEGVRNYTLVPSWGTNTVNLEGTSGSDTVGSAGSIVTINGVGVDLGAGTTQLNVLTHGGDDTVILPLTLSGLSVYVNTGDQNDFVSMAGATVPSVLETGKGFSTIRGGDGPTTILAGGGLNKIQIGDGNTLVMGRDGQNTIFGGTGRSLIITGKNYARVQGGTGGKYVVVGTTSYDNFLPALDRVLAEWSSSASYNVRVRHIQNGTGPYLGGVQLQVGRTVDLSNRKSRVVGLTGVDKIVAGATDKVGWVSPIMPISAHVPAAKVRKVVKKAGK